MVKLAIIGAGSAVFWMSMLRDLSVMKSAPGSTFSLVDVNKGRLDAVYDLGRRYAKEIGVDITFEKSDQRAEALEDADFVLNTALVKGHEWGNKMISIGEKHGYYRGIEQRNVWFINSFTQFKLALDIASDMEEICPNAWLLQIANPVFDITTLLNRERPKVKSVGFCDGYVGIYGLMIALGLSPAEVDFQVAGFNHCIYLTKFRDMENKTDLYPKIDEWLEKAAEEFWNKHEIGLWQETLSRAAADVYKHYGLYPIGDTNREHIWKYYDDLDTRKKWLGHLGGTDSEIGTPLRLGKFQENVDRLFRLTNDPSASITEEVSPTKGLDEFSDFIDAIHLGEEKRLVLNIPNKGIMPQFPDNVAVEVPVQIKNRVLVPEHPEPFPKRLLNFVLIPKMLRMEWNVDAFHSRSKEMLVEILVRDQRTRSEKQAKDTIEEILSVPENRDLAEYYK